MSINSQWATSLVVHWLDKHKYSRNHWQTVANEMIVKAKDDPKDAELLLAEALKSFHNIYQEKVVQKDNLLSDLLNQCFEVVDWIAVARNLYQ